MMEAQEKDTIDKGMRTLWLIWGAMLGSLLIYIFLCHQLGEGFRSGAGADIPIDLLRKIFFGVAAAALLTGYYLRRFLLKARSEAARSAMVRRAAALNQLPFVTQYTAVVIVSLALSESIGIYGLVLFLLGGGFKTLYIFIAVSALAMVFYRPKREEMERLAMAYKQAGEESHY
jgi:hypothetical protein